MAHPHSKIGASQCERWWNCPGSVREIAKCPPQPDSEYAKDGTAAHKLAETCLKENADPFLYIGVTLAGTEKVISEEMAEAVQEYLNVIDSDLEKHALMRKDLQVEQRFHLTHIHQQAYGTCDVVLPVFLTKVIVYDFKYGSGVAVDAEDNKQGLYYALGAAEGGNYEEFEIVIVQPRAVHKSGPVRRWSVNKATLEEFGEDLRVHIGHTEAEDAPLHCGKWCQKTFCPAIVCCREVRHDMEQAAMVVFDAQPKAILPRPEELTPLMLRRLLDMVPIIDAYLRAVEAFALDQANKGVEIIDYKLVARRSNRKWKDEQAVIKKFGKKVAVKVIEEVLSPSQLETKLKESMKLKEAKAAIEPLTFKPDTGNVLVPYDDPREAVKPQIEHVFEEKEDLFS
jgi:hypothetical protein